MLTGSTDSDKIINIKLSTYKALIATIKKLSASNRDVVDLIECAQIQANEMEKESQQKIIA